MKMGGRVELLEICCLLLLLSGNSQCRDSQTEHLSSYQLTVPRPIGGRLKRDVHGEPPSQVSYMISVDGRDHVVHLERNQLLLPADFTVFSYSQNGSLLTSRPPVQNHCHYQGFVQDMEGSSVAMSICNGLSDAILKYLATKYDVPEHWYPRKPERRARVDEYTAWHHSNTRPHAAKVFILEVLLPAQTGSQVEEGRLIRALSQLDDTLDKLESMFLRRQPFLCGDDITVADLLAVCELMQPLGGARDVLQQRPQLQRWRTRVQSAVGDSFDRAHAVLYALRDRRKAKL